MLDFLLADSVGPANPEPNGFLASLSDLAESTITSIASSAAGALVGRAEGAINNAPRSSNTAPVPDVTAAAASPGVSTFVDSKPFGVSLPVLLIGGAALLFLFAPRLRR